MIQERPSSVAPLLNQLKVTEDLLWASTQGPIIELEQALIWLQLSAELMNYVADMQGQGKGPLAPEQCEWLTIY